MLPTVPETLLQTAEKYPEKEAVVFPEEDVRITYNELGTVVGEFSNVLKNLGVKKGDTISVALHNSLEMVISIFSIPMAGGTFSPVNFRLAPREASYILNDSTTKVVLFDEETREMIEAAREDLETVEHFVYTDDDTGSCPEFAEGFHRLISNSNESYQSDTVSLDDPWAIVYTSGTTGRPKGVIHTHENATYHNLLMMQRMTTSSIGLLIMPLYHNAALNTSLLPIVNIGGTSVILDGFEADRVLQTIDEEGVTSVSLPSRVWRQVLDAKENSDFVGSQLERIGYGTSDMPRSLLEELTESFGEIVSTSYGMTEMGPVATHMYPQDVTEKLGSVGQPLPNHDVRIVETESDEPHEGTVSPDDTVPAGTEGEIILTGPCMMKGYLNRPEKTEGSVRNGWFFTGDIGYKDEDNFVYIVDRVDDMIISGGENIYPTEVEEILYNHEYVGDVAVVGLDDEQWGEVVTAFVVPNVELPDEELTSALEEHCLNSDELADYKRPRRYRFREKLPKNPSGKIQRYKLRETEP